MTAVTGLTTGAPALPAECPRGGGTWRTLTGCVSGLSGGPEVMGTGACQMAATASAWPGRASGSRAETGRVSGTRAACGTGLTTGAPRFPAVMPRRGGVIRVRTGWVSGVTGGPDVGCAGA